MYEIKNFTDTSVKENKKPRKIKFKNVSFLNIMKKITDFLEKREVNKLEQKLVEAKENLTDSRFLESEMKKNNRESSFAEEVIYKKSLAVSRLEEKLNFINSNGIDTIDEGEDRAIKLKDKMMETLRHNIDPFGRHYIPEHEIKSILNEQNEEETKENSQEVVQEKSQEIESEIKKLNEAIDNIKVSKDENTQTTVDALSNITVESVENIVNKSFEEESKKEEKKEASEEKVTYEDVNNIVNKDLEEENKKEKINFEDINNIINKDLDEDKEVYSETFPISPIEKVSPVNIPKVDGSEISVKDNKDINEDIFGNADKEIKEDNVVSVENTAENIRDEVIIVPDREESILIEKTKEDISNLEGKVDEFANAEDVDKEQIEKEIQEIEKEIIEDKSNLTEEEANELKEDINEEVKQVEEPIREEKKKIPQEENIGFDLSGATSKDIEQVIDKTTSTKDLAAMIEKIRVLELEKKRTEEQINKAREEEAAKDKQYNETMEKLYKYGNGLEEECNKNLAEKDAIVNKTKEKDEAISTMLKAMGIQEPDTQQKKK